MSNERTIARPYAQAAFNYALSSSQLEAWSGFLNTAADVASNEKVVELIKNPQINDQDIANMFIKVCGGEKLSQPMQNFIRMLASYHRFLFLSNIAEIFNELKLVHEQTLTAQVFSSESISGEQEKELIAALEKRFKQKVILEQVLDNSLIGGALIRVGDYVIDGSVRGRLERLRNSLNLKERVCHQ